MVDIKSFKPEQKAPENSLMAEMAIELMVNENDQLFIFHEKKFKKPLEKISYDNQQGRLRFLFADNEEKDLGMAAPVDLQESLKKVKEANCFFVKDKERIEDFQKVPFIIDDKKD